MSEVSPINKATTPKQLPFRRNCLCDFCTRINPMQKRIRDALPAELQSDFEYITMRMMCAEEDRDVAESKLHGQWPGWEWMAKAVEDAEKIQPPD